jgi:hypothetical protein|tara:strand:- start:335 stop:751 length:417 start_codon:yes stop_codon:yes gene_type:complete
MTGLVYKELPIGDITHLTRPEFINGQEQKFHDTLLNSVKQYGMRDPVFIDQRKDKDDKVILKVTVGNNRMVIAKELGFKLVRSIVKLLKPDDNNIEGTPINNEQEIIDLFHTKEGLDIRKKDGIIWEVMPKNHWRNGF